MTERITAGEALRLLKEGHLPELMLRADRRRRELHGRTAYFVHSLNINPTNVCENKCDLCAFWREAGSREAYTISLADAEERLKAARGTGLTDLHVVGGLESHLDLGFHEELFRLAKSILPGICIQGLTAVEIHYLAAGAGISTIETLKRLKASGLDALPGGGAEIFDESVRKRICSSKIPAQEWLRIHQEAHSAGMPTNATMLFGHIEKSEHLVDHMLRLRELQDRTGGIEAFIPLPFHPAGTRIGVECGPSGHEIARVVAVARLFLDNIPHIRVLANYVDRKLLEVLAYSGVDDLGGTSEEERIARAAGAPDNHRFVSVEDMAAFSRSLDLEPRLVNSIYQGVGRISRLEAPEVSGPPASPPAAEGLRKAENGERISAAEAVAMHDEIPFQALGILADRMRHRLVPGQEATFVVDRNISLTNVCTAGCRFCAFHVKPGEQKGFTMAISDVARAVRESIEAGATQVLIQGGLNPELNIEFYEEMLMEVRRQGDICIHSLSPAEIAYMAGRAGLSLRETLQRLHAAGLDSLPGGGAEILVDDVRGSVSPGKLSADGWLEVMRTAQQLGLKTTATMVYGLGETTAQRIQHFIRVRELQDETGGFTAFIPWSFQPHRTGLDIRPATGVDYLKVLALARLVVDNIPHVQAGWVTEGPDLAQLALSYGADDFGGVLMEEKVVKATGTEYSVNRDDVVRLIQRAGFKPVQRTTQYKPLRSW